MARPISGEGAAARHRVEVPALARWITDLQGHKESAEHTGVGIRVTTAGCKKQA